jgi:hypothetical protein
MNQIRKEIRMNILHDTEWCRTTWQLLVYLESVYDALAAQPSLKVGVDDWGADVDEDAGIGFTVKPKSRKGPFYLWIGMWIKENGLIEGRPIWIEVLRNDPNIWTNLKDEFEEGKMAPEEEDTWAVGLEWVLPKEASGNEVKQAGERLAARISQVLSLGD